MLVAHLVWPGPTDGDGNVHLLQAQRCLLDLNLPGGAVGFARLHCPRLSGLPRSTSNSSAKILPLTGRFKGMTAHGDRRHGDGSAVGLEGTPGSPGAPRLAVPTGWFQVSRCGPTRGLVSPRTLRRDRSPLDNRRLGIVAGTRLAVAVHIYQVVLQHAPPDTSRVDGPRRHDNSAPVAAVSVSTPNTPARTHADRVGTTGNSCTFSWQSSFNNGLTSKQKISKSPLWLPSGSPLSHTYSPEMNRSASRCAPWLTAPALFDFFQALCPWFRARIARRRRLPQSRCTANVKKPACMP